MFKKLKQNRIFKNNERKFYQQVSGEYTWINQNAKDVKQFWSKICDQKELNSEAKSINIMKKELQRLEEVLVANIHMILFIETVKKVKNWKTSDHDGIDRFWF